MTTTIEKPKTVEKPVSGGFWRNAYLVEKHEGWLIGEHCGWEKMPDGRYLYKDTFPSREIAESNINSPCDWCGCFDMNHWLQKNIFVWDEAIHFEGKQ